MLKNVLFNVTYYKGIYELPIIIIYVKNTLESNNTNIVIGVESLVCARKGYMVLPSIKC